MADGGFLCITSDLIDGGVVMASAEHWHATKPSQDSLVGEGCEIMASAALSEAARLADDDFVNEED